MSRFTLQVREIGGNSYRVSGSIKTQHGETIPILDIPMMDEASISDQAAIAEYTQRFGRAPESATQARIWKTVCAILDREGAAI